jgi:O-antigen/teichoic acid export membrane protein
MSIVHTLVLVALNILLLVVWKTGVEGYLIANIAGNVIPTIILFFATGAYKEVITAPFDKKLLVNMLKFSIPLVANNLSWWVLNSSDKVMIEAALSASDLGIYTAASKIPALLSIVTSIFSQAWTVSSIKEYDSDKDKSFYATVFKYFSIVMFFGATFVILILKPFMQVYVGMDFYSAWIYVPALLLGSVFFSFGSFFGAIYGALRKNSAVAFTTILAAVINIVINLIFIPVIGVAAAAISTAVSYIVMGLIRMLHSRKYYKFEINFVQFALNAVLITAEIILIMLGQNIYIVASAALILLTIINFRDLAGIKNWMFAFVKQKFSRGRKKHEG